MTQQGIRAYAIAVTLGATIMVAACNKKEAQAPPLPRSPADQSASIWVDPSHVSEGGTASLTWRTTNATEVFIGGIGPVPANGSHSVSPKTSTTYHLTAKGAGGSLEVTTRVNVTQPPPPRISAAPVLQGGLSR